VDKGEDGTIELDRTANDLKAAVDKAVGSLKGGDRRAFGNACDEYRTNAQDFAAAILRERIRQSFDFTIDPTTGHSREHADDKIEHARRIRSWLMPWNLGFYQPRTGALFQVKGATNGTRGGVYRLNSYGRSLGSEIARWEDVKGILLSSELRDVTDYIYHRNTQHLGHASRVTKDRSDKGPPQVGG
jgi:hypothetical protein